MIGFGVPSPAITALPRIVAAILLIVALAAALSVDVVKAGQGVKSDEATHADDAQRRMIAT